MFLRAVVQEGVLPAEVRTGPGSSRVERIGRGEEQVTVSVQRAPVEIAVDAVHREQPPTMKAVIDDARIEPRNAGELRN